MKEFIIMLSEIKTDLVIWAKSFFEIFKTTTNIKYKKLCKWLKNKIVVFTGQTGAGKSSLLNRIDKSLNLKTDEISEALGRGKHTTRRS